MARMIWTITVMLLCHAGSSNELDPITWSLAGVGAVAGLSVFKAGYCKLKECCTPAWTCHALSQLRGRLDERLYGQHIATEVIMRTLPSHVTNDNPSKALVLSLHGPSGTGKNHISNIIAETLYYKGLKSQYVKRIVATHNFPLRDRPELYIDKFKAMITSTVEGCERALIIIDEIHNMPKGLLSYAGVYMDHHDSIDGVDYRKTIFLLLSTIAEQEISSKALQQWRGGLPREDIQRLDMHNIIATAAYNYDGGGYFKTDLIKHNLVDFFVCMLPLERSHVKKCIESELHRRRRSNIGDDRISEMASQVHYQPKLEQIFSTSGCRKIDKIIDLYL